uniref:Uncharacterized protein n=1 Tax=Proboscia inermis TaxID=420281 RepID=A0A7S0G9Q7_9STRA|mmetsp:Transcript_15940/g.16112  ORF Transcript_15940/g.16112 Transcript_15940/m.16112 type:complete len:188 (+) Transcript_15940:364-927(+)
MNVCVICTSKSSHTYYMFYFNNLRTKTSPVLNTHTHLQGQLAFLPTLVLAAKICPPGVEAVLFATLMSIFNGAGVTGSEIGALLTKMLGITESNFDNLGLLTIICNLSSLYPLLLLNTLLDGVDDLKDDDGNDNDDMNGDLLLNGGVENAMIFEANGGGMGVLSSDDVADETVLDIPFFCTVIEETP